MEKFIKFVPGLIVIISQEISLNLTKFKKKVCRSVTRGNNRVCFSVIGIIKAGEISEVFIAYLESKENFSGMLS